MDENAGHGGKRMSLKKAHHSNWKEKLRVNCLKRVQSDRSRLLWKIRSPGKNPPLNQKEVVESAFREIVSDELKKISQSSSDNCREASPSDVNDVLWEYDGPHMFYQSIEGECEELMIEMESLFYRDLKEELTMEELDVNDQSWKEEEDYLAQAVYEHMQLNDDQVGKDGRIWCPICKKGNLCENHHLIFCTCCKLQLDTKSDKGRISLRKQKHHMRNPESLKSP